MSIEADLAAQGRRCSFTVLLKQSIKGVDAAAGAVIDFHHGKASGKGIATATVAVYRQPRLAESLKRKARNSGIRAYSQGHMARCCKVQKPKMSRAIGSPRHAAVKVGCGVESRARWSEEKRLTASN